MTTAHIKISPREGGGLHLYLNGEDIAHYVIAGGVKIEFPSQRAGLGMALVTVTLQGEVDLDLPDALLSVIRPSTPAATLGVHPDDWPQIPTS